MKHYDVSVDLHANCSVYVIFIKCVCLCSVKTYKTSIMVRGTLCTVRVYMYLQECNDIINALFILSKYMYKCMYALKTTCISY